MGLNVCCRLNFTFYFPDFQFRIKKRVTLEEMRKLERETLTGNHIRELVEFFLKLEENVKAELNSMNKVDKKEAVINIHEASDQLTKCKLHVNL